MTYYVTSNTMNELRRRRNLLAHSTAPTDDPQLLRRRAGLLGFFNAFLQNTVTAETDADGWHHFLGKDGQFPDEGLGFRFFLPDGLALPADVLEEALQYAKSDDYRDRGFASLGGNGCFCQLSDSTALGSSLWEMIEWVEQKMEYRAAGGPQRSEYGGYRKAHWGPQVCVMEAHHPWVDALHMMRPNFGNAYVPLLAVPEKHLDRCRRHGVTAANYAAGYLQKKDSPLFDGARADFTEYCGPELELPTAEGPLAVPTHACAMICHPFAPMEQLLDPQSESFCWHMPVPF